MCIYKAIYIYYIYIGIGWLVVYFLFSLMWDILLGHAGNQSPTRSEFSFPIETVSEFYIMRSHRV